MLKLLSRLLTDERGTTAVEYGLVATLVALAVLGTLSTLGDRIKQSVSIVSEQFSSASP